MILYVHLQVTAIRLSLLVKTLVMQKLHRLCWEYPSLLIWVKSGYFSSGDVLLGDQSGHVHGEKEENPCENRRTSRRGKTDQNLHVLLTWLSHMLSAAPLCPSKHSGRTVQSWAEPSRNSDCRQRCGWNHAKEERWWGVLGGHISHLRLVHCPWSSPSVIGHHHLTLTSTEIAFSSPFVKNFFLPAGSFSFNPISTISLPSCAFPLQFLSHSLSFTTNASLDMLEEQTSAILWTPQNAQRHSPTRHRLAVVLGACRAGEQHPCHRSNWGGHLEQHPCLLFYCVPRFAFVQGFHLIFFLKFALPWDWGRDSKNEKGHSSYLMFSDKKVTWLVSSASEGMLCIFTKMLYFSLEENSCNFLNVDSAVDCLSSEGNLFHVTGRMKQLAVLFVFLLSVGASAYRNEWEFSHWCW